MCFLNIEYIKPSGDGKCISLSLGGGGGVVVSGTSGVYVIGAAVIIQIGYV
jgi:hypothetical protein